MIPSTSFVLDGRITTIDFQDPAGPRPTTTVLNFLRSLPTHRGVKEGCAEGDCGACTVVLGELQNGKLQYRAVDSCLVFLPMIHGKQLITVENLKNGFDELHPVQQAMVETGGSQCGYCTPGIIMSLFALYKNANHPSRAEVDDALTGNLCRCTGYKPIIEAARRSCVNHGKDHLTNFEEQTVELLQSIPNQSLELRTSRQQYFQPVTLNEALSLMREHAGAIVICGATDIALRVTKKHELLEKVIDLSTTGELKKISEGASSITIGAGASLSDAMPRIQKGFPALYDMLTVFGSQQIRNLATFGGNLGTASPIGDLLPVLMAYDAKVVLQNLDGKREVSLDDFIISYRKTLQKPDELITAVIIPKIIHGERSRTMNGAVVKSYKVSKRKDLDIATVSAAFRLELNGGRTVESIKLAYGGMAERIKRAEAAEKFLIGKPWTRESVSDAMNLIEKEFVPISDARGSAEFRKIVARNLLMKFWSETNH